jgi:hypothetical protein
VAAVIFDNLNFSFADSTLPGSLGDKLAHLLLHFRGVALGAGDLAGLEFLQAHDARKLFPAFNADVFISGHDPSPFAFGNTFYIQ